MGQTGPSVSKDAETESAPASPSTLPSRHPSERQCWSSTECCNTPTPPHISITSVLESFFFLKVTGVCIISFHSINPVPQFVEMAVGRGGCHLRCKISIGFQPLLNTYADNSQSVQPQSEAARDADQGFHSHRALERVGRAKQDTGQLFAGAKRQRRVKRPVWSLGVGLQSTQSETSSRTAAGMAHEVGPHSHTTTQELPAVPRKVTHQPRHLGQRVIRQHRTAIRSHQGYLGVFFLVTVIILCL